MRAAIVGAMPVGSIIGYPGSVAPVGWHLCIGETALRSDYPSLIEWAVLNDLIGDGKLFGAGDGTTTFDFPDLRELVLVGAGKSARPELDAAGHAHDVYAVGEFKDDQMQKITGTFESARSATSGTTTGAFYTSSTFSSDRSIGATGSAVPHSVYGLDTSRVARAGTVTHGKQIGMNYIIKI